jgi:hypothetical protein
MPDVHFDLGELYSGSIPINESNPNKNLFFFYQPTTGKPVNEITIWLNGSFSPPVNGMNELTFPRRAGMQLAGRLLPGEWPVGLALRHISAVRESVLLGQPDQYALVRTRPIERVAKLT